MGSGLFLFLTAKRKTVLQGLTGGGKPPVFTPSEDSFLSSHSTASEVVGIPGAVDISQGRLIWLYISINNLGKYSSL